MNVQAELDTIRTAAPGCSLAAFGDLRTRLVLRVSADQIPPQERLDELCSLGARCFAQADADAVHTYFPGSGNDAPNEAVVLGPKDIKLFVRSETDDTDMVFCLCESADAVPDLLRSAQQALRDF